FEPFSDVGVDGLADAQEPGYDPVANPDPDGDDYHALYNPRGTEGDGDRQAGGAFGPGEPFEDVGLDGVASTCQRSPSTPGCYDFGEGDGEWTISPNVRHWYTHDIGTILGVLDPDQRRRVGIWMDAGIRDFLNASVSANAGMGEIMSRRALPGAVFDGFGEL